MGIIELYYSLAYNNEGNGREAIEHSKNCLKYFTKTNWPYLSGLGWASSGQGYYLIGDLETCVKQIKKGLNIQKNTKIILNMDFYYLVLSNVHYDMGDFTTAKKYAEEAYNLTQKYNDRHAEGLINIRLGKILSKMNDSNNNKAKKYMLKGIESLEELKLRPYLAHGYFALGEFFADLNRNEDALINLNKALSIYHELENQYWPDKVQEVLDRL